VETVACNSLLVTEERLRAVILSEVKNLSSFGLSELQRSFLRFTQDRLQFLRMTVARVLNSPVSIFCFPFSSFCLPLVPYGF
jgi:hypothetical protein